MGMWVPWMQPMIWGMWNFCWNRHAMAMAYSAVGTVMMFWMTDDTIPLHNT